MIVSFIKERDELENRTAVTPESCEKLIKAGYTVKIEYNAGIKAGFSDDEYKEAGASIVNSDEALMCRIIISVGKISAADIKKIKPDSLIISLLNPHNNKDLLAKLASNQINAAALELIPRTTKAQSMDVLSSQNNAAGYKAVLIAAQYLNKMFPLLMTAAGTITPAKVFIMGAGVAGLQALGTARRLGAVVEVTDIRSAAKEEVLSLGGKFIDMNPDVNLQDEKGYAKEVSSEFLKAQQEKISSYLAASDIVITTALVPGKKAPILITKEQVMSMKRGSVIVDMAVEAGGNCESSEHNKTVEVNGVTIVGIPSLASLVPKDASRLFANNIYNLLIHMTKENQFNIDLNDDIVSSIMTVYKGEVRL